jgi:hypothetical protein
MYHCDKTLPPELNRMAIEIYGRRMVEGRTASERASAICEAICARMPTRHACAYLDAEYNAKNIIDDETGVRAIGARLARGIPGLYWLNFFGAPYVELMGREKLLTAPAYEVKPVGDGVLVALAASAEAWQSADYKQRGQAVIAHLGRQFFFSRDDPDRPLVAPDYDAQANPPGAK